MNVFSTASPAMRFRRFGMVSAVTIVTIGALAACSTGSASPEDGADATTLVVGIAGDPATFDPGTASESIANELIKNTYFQWTKYGVDESDDYGISDVAEILGEAASYTMSDDNLTATFTVAEGAVFPSGNPITSADFSWTVERAITTGTGPSFIFNTAGITDISQVTIVSDTEFTITLPAPSPMFGQLLRDQDAAVLDSELIKKNATDDDPWATEWMAQNNVGGGAYTLETYDAGNQIVLTKNEDYPSADDVYFEKVIMQIIPSETDRAQLLADGTLDIAEGLGVDAADGLKSTEGVQLLDIPSRSQNLISLVEGFEPFADVRVREAIAHALPYDQISEDVSKGYSLTPLGLWPQNSSSFAADLTNNPYTTDIDEAKSLLADAGYADGFEFTLDVSTADASGQALAVVVQSALAEIGVTMDINQMAPAALSEQQFAQTGQAFMTTGSSSYVDDPYYSLFLFFTSDAVLNRYGFSDEGIDSIAASLATETDAAARLDLSAQAQEILNEQVPVIILNEPNYVLAMGDDISGFVLEPDSLIRFSTLTRG